MGILEAIFIGFFGAVGGLTFFTEPTDIAIDDIYIPNFEEQGLTHETVLGLLNQRVVELQADAGISPLDDVALRLNFKDSAVSRFAAELGIMEHVSNVQAIFDLVDYRMSIAIYASQEESNEYRDIITALTADIFLLETRSGRLIRSVRVTGDGDMLSILDKVAEQIIVLGKPSAHALQLLVKEMPLAHKEMLILNEPVPAGTFVKTRNFLEEWLVIHAKGSYQDIGTNNTKAYERRQMQVRARMFNLLGLVEMMEGNYKRSHQSFLKSVQVDQNFASGYINMGAILGLQGKYEPALSYLRKGVNIEKDTPVAYLYAAAVLWKQGKVEKALKVLDKLEHMPGGTGISDLYRLRALIYENLITTHATYGPADGQSHGALEVEAWGRLATTAHREQKIAKFKNPFQFGLFAR